MNCNIRHTIRILSLFLLIFSIRMNSSITMIFYRRFAPSIRERDTPKFKNIIRIPGAQFEIRQLVFAQERTCREGGKDDWVSRSGIKCSHLAPYADVSAIRENERIAGDVSDARELEVLVNICRASWFPADDKTSKCGRARGG